MIKPGAVRYDKATSPYHGLGVKQCQQINFTVLGDPETGSGLNLYVTEQAGLTSENAVLQYSGVATSSVPLLSMALTPRIWKHTASGDVLVYTGTSKACMNVPECRLSGTFVPLWDISNVTATYFANITTIYTMPQEIRATNPGVPAKLAMVQNSPGDEPVPEVVVTGPLSPVPPGTAASAENINNSVPWGGTIEHVMDGDVPMTVVYDASGQPQYRADDRDAEAIWTPWGDTAISTNILMIPNATFLNSTAADVVTLKKAPSGLADENEDTILTINYRNPVQTPLRNFHHTGVTTCQSVVPNWVEWAEMSTSSISNFNSFNTNWIIPAHPDATEVGPDRKILSGRTQVTSWNGLENSNGILQTVPGWNWFYDGAGTYNFDRQWSWAIWGGDSTHTLTWLTTPESLNDGDSFAATYWVSSSTDSSTTWRIHAGPTSRQKEISWSTSDLKNDNVDLEVTEEAYLLANGLTHVSTVHDVKYFQKNTRFTNFIIQDTSGNTVTPAFTGCVNQNDWGQYISTLRMEITNNPYAITLHTTS